MVRSCIYCGATDKLTKDHVPPRNLFPSPQPSNLITVPSCEACNANASKDDEYFRLIITMRRDPGNHAQVRKLLPAVFRGLEKPEKLRFTRAFLKGLKRSEVVTQGGIYLGTAPTYDVDLSRLDRVVQRTVLGLFYHESGRRLSPTHEINSYLPDEIALENEDQLDDLKKLLTWCLGGSHVDIGEGVFSYWFNRVQDDPDSTGWLLRFYEAVHCLCVTAPSVADKHTR